MPEWMGVEGYYDENDSTLRKEVMRKPIRLEAFIFLRLPGALGACYSCLGLHVFLCAIRYQEYVCVCARVVVYVCVSSMDLKVEVKEVKQIVRLLQFS